MATNIIQDADRSMTLGMLLLMATVIVLRRIPAPTSSEWRMVWMGGV